MNTERGERVKRESVEPGALQTTPRATPLGVVLLAAGRSRRMGRPKLLLPWGTTTVLGHLIEQWRRLGAAQLAVVRAGDDHKLSSELDRLGFPQRDRIPNPSPELGMFSSIQCAARWAGWSRHITHWAIVLGDQPHLRPETLRTLLDWATAHPKSVCQPARNGHRRHPVILPKTLFLSLADTPALTLKDFLVSMSIAVCEIDDPGLDLDLDRPEDYQQALRIREDARGGDGSSPQGG